MTNRLIQLLSALERPRLLVVGDLILDEYVWGGVERISPEAPIPVLRVRRREQRPGGAGSVVANLACLGADVTVLSAVGADGAGHRLLGYLEGMGCDISLVARVADRATTLKARHLGFVQHADRAVQQLLRVDTEETGPFPADVSAELLKGFAERRATFDAILVSDYDKGLLAADFLAELLRLAGEVPVLADPARLEDYSRYRGAFLVCPNRYETALATNERCDEVAGCTAAGKKLGSEHGFEFVAVTMDRDGILLARRDGSSVHFRTEARTVADVTGAGDMVLSLLGLVIGAGGDVEDAVRLANVAAGIEIGRLGASPVTREEIQRELRYQGHAGAAKVKDLSELLPRVRELRSAGRTIVFTNGCFDLLHYGHHHLLNRAKRLGDCLIVAVNSDASVRRIKGHDRPFTREGERLLMLSGLECIDYAILFEDDTPIPLLEAIRPDILVKGAEYRDGEVVGRGLVESYGGRVELIEQIPGVSTTAILGPPPAAGDAERSGGR
jgi:D-beta-D-heptose 7-phosphate kinase/D-beta-D-heptose 1-phosphate adenosyltransferase